MKLTEQGFAGHFICADRCRFFRTTDIGTKWRVSTVGAYYSSLNKHGKMEEIGCARFYETMVFPLGKEVCGCGCKARTVSEWSEKDFEGYQTAGEATKGHAAMVEKWSRPRRKEAK